MRTSKQLFTSCLCMLLTFTSSEAALLSSASFFAFSASFLAAYSKTHCRLQLELLITTTFLTVSRIAELDWFQCCEVTRVNTHKLDQGSGMQLDASSTVSPLDLCIQFANELLREAVWHICLVLSMVSTWCWSIGSKSVSKPMPNHVSCGSLRKPTWQ